MPRKPIPKPPQYPSTVHARARTYTSAEARQQRQLVEQLWVQGIDSPRRIADTISQIVGYKMPRTRVVTLLERVRDEQAQLDVSTLAERKRRQVQRLLDDARKARAEKKWSAVASIEKLIADIDGTMAPIQVQHDHRVQHAITNVLSELTPEDFAALVEEQRAIDAKAKAFDELTPTSVEVVAEPRGVPALVRRVDAAE